MAASEALKKPHLRVHESASAEIKQKSSSKLSSSRIIFKSLILVFVLVVIPLFPSQAPDFITQSLITNFWELVHLLFVGIAVCYGLFCRKCVEIETEIGYENGNDNSDSIISGVLNISSFFENGVDNLCISDNGYQDGNKKVKSFSSRNGSEGVCENVEEKKGSSQIRNFRYFKGESLVVVSNNGNYELENEYKSLGLPVRSLRSGIADDTPEFENSRSKVSASDDNEEKVERIRGLIPTNLEKKFEEVATPLRSRSVRIESKDLRNVDSKSHFRLHSAGEFEFEHLESKPVSLQYPVSTSRCSSKSSSSGSSIETSKPKTQNSETEKDFEGSFSEKEMMPQKSKYSYLNSIKSGTLNSNMKSSSSFGNLKKNTMQDQQRSDNFSYSSGVSSNLTKTRPRAKSVRTIRSNKYVFDKMKKEDNDEDHRMFDQLEDLKNEEESKHSPVHKQKHHHSEKVHPFQIDDNVLLPTLEEKKSVSKKGVSVNSHELSDENEESVKLNEVVDDEEEEELVGSEVDRKADEFIAKFRQQIRLQKVVPSN